MGNSNNSNQYGGIIIQTDKPYYFPGEMVSGNIYVDVIHPNYPGHSLVLKLKGQEKCEWSEQKTRRVKGLLDTRPKTEHYTEKQEDKRVIISSKVPVYSFGQQTIQQGQYSFPFQFQLRPDLPGSFESKGADYNGSVEYFLAAKIPKSKSDAPTFKGKLVFQIREKANTKTENLLLDKTMNIKQCGCFDKGVTYYTCNLERNMYVAKEPCQLRVDIDNSRCGAGVTMVEAELINDLTLSTQNGLSKKISKVLATKAMPGVAAGQQTQQVNISIPLNGPMGQPISGGTSGNLVRNLYFIRVRLQMDTMKLCSTYPELDMQIQIFQEAIQQPEIQQPQNWQPQVIQINNLAFDQQGNNGQNQNIVIQNQGMGMESNRVHPQE